MHLIRLYLTGIDVLEGRGIRTHRSGELALLRGIRAGEVPMDRVFRMAEEYDKRMQEAFHRSSLPDQPDMGRIDELLLEIYREM